MMRMACRGDRHRHLRLDGDRARQDGGGRLHEGSGDRAELVISAGTVTEALIVAARRNVAYEFAKEHACPLLYGGDDFSKTDLTRAV
jgi:hypothetical protein